MSYLSVAKKCGVKFLRFSCFYTGEKNKDKYSYTPSSTGEYGLRIVQSKVGERSPIPLSLERRVRSLKIKSERRKQLKIKDKVLAAIRPTLGIKNVAASDVAMGALLSLNHLWIRKCKKKLSNSPTNPVNKSERSKKRFLTHVLKGVKGSERTWTSVKEKASSILKSLRKVGNLNGLTGSVGLLLMSSILLGLTISNPGLLYILAAAIVVTSVWYICRTIHHGFIALRATACTGRKNPSTEAPPGTNPS